MPLKDPVARAAYNREYSRRHRDELNEYTARWRREKYASDERYRDAVRATTQAVPKHVHAAHMRVYKALKRGEITRPPECSKCGRATFVEAAHINYTERLAIRWLCRSCHRGWDAAQPKTEEPPTVRQFTPRRITKLDHEKATEIRKAYAGGEAQGSIATRYGVSRALIGQVVRGKLWT